MNKNRISYSELITIPTLKERFEYVSLSGQPFEETFGWSRYLNQALYCSPEWKRLRRQIIIRDNGCELSLEPYEIHSRLIVHHLNPISLEDVETRSPLVFDQNNLVCVSHTMHEAIHYGDWDLVPKDPIERTAGDTKLW